MHLTTTDLTNHLRTLSAESIRETGWRLRHETLTAADEVAWWSATARVGRQLRSQGRRLAAATAAGIAAQAVKHAALRAGLALDDPDVILVARAASDAATAVVADNGTLAETRYFLDRLQLPVFSTVAA